VLLVQPVHKEFKVSLDPQEDQKVRKDLRVFQVNLVHKASPVQLVQMVLRVCKEIQDPKAHKDFKD